MSNIKLFGNTGSAHLAGRKANKPERRQKPERQRPETQRPERTQKPKKTKRRGRRALTVIAIILVLLVGLYCLCVFSNIPFIAKWRTIYIQTAMDTMHHQWLATAFLPKSVIDEAMSLREDAIAEQGEHNSSEDWVPKVTAPHVTQSKEEFTEDEFYELFWELDKNSMQEYIDEHPDVLSDGWGRLCINEAGLDDKGTSIETTMGEQVLAIDVPNRILLVRVSGSGYRGVLAVAKDPSRLTVENASTLGSYGEQVGTIAEAHNGVLAMNASGFADEGGVGFGGSISGYAMSNGVGYGDHLEGNSKRIELREDNYLYIVDSQSAVDPETTDAVEFTPAIIVDGKRLNTYGWDSLNPRAVIGQSDRGEILMLVIEGRLVDSIGVSVDECGKILEKHNCMQAMNLDGGTSAILWYDGECVTRCSNQALPGGRQLPNAFVYARAED